ncbi:MAG: tRNA uridine-5-carboxymethylaminomethyl(34) synthesis GTPase MnmE [Pararhodobacter sp.]|nr:tRNA uridine-5-carboxymethylaminomethyl(34) synthesis GTPase MnmE [Pararhodobacter sp.]
MRTIVALASARGRAGVSIIRVSGPSAWAVCQQLCGALPTPRQASLRTLRDEEGDIIDQALVLLFEEGKSYTSEKLAEFHVHGSPAVIQAVLAACLSHDDIRAALPGEFTRRAYEAGNLSILQVEGLADLIDADTQKQRKLALQLFGGGAQAEAAEWREEMLKALSLIEAGIDFSDEELPDGLKETVAGIVRQTIRRLDKQLSSRRVSERIRDGATVAIVGKVNVGKSTLLNALTGREVALTSEYAGTTRDVIEVRLDIDGVPVSLIDTAGVRETADPVESLGIERGKLRAEEADLRIYLKETPEEAVMPQSENDIVLLAKCDLWGLPGVSGRTGEGVDALIARLSERLIDTALPSSMFSRERHFDSLLSARKALGDAARMLESDERADEMISFLIREAATSLDSLIGHIDVEEVLGGIFAKFCIGK